MFLQSILRWPWFLIAFAVAAIFSFSSPGWAGLLNSAAIGNQTENASRLELEKKLIGSSLAQIGWSREVIDARLDRLNQTEIHRLAGAVDGIKAGGEEEPAKRAAGVGIAILIVLGAVTGFYLFYQSNK